MQVIKDGYRAEQVGIMLRHESNPEEVHYAAKLSHWNSDSKTINVEADALALLHKAYSGEYVEVNEPERELSRKRYLFWSEYQYKDHPLVFVCLPHLTNRDTIEILRLWDEAYGDTDQETPDWALEFQILTRMLVHEKCLLVNPVHLDASDEGFCQKLLAALPHEDRAEYVEARALNQEDIARRHQEREENFGGGNSEGDYICPVCGQEIDSDDIDLDSSEEDGYGGMTAPCTCAHCGTKLIAEYTNEAGYEFTGFRKA